MSTLRTEIAALKRRVRSLPGANVCHTCGGPHMRTWVDILMAYDADVDMCDCATCRICEGWREQLAEMVACAEQEQTRDGVLTAL